MSFIYAVACIRSLFLLLLSSILCMIYQDLFILSPVDHLGCFQSLTISNKPACSCYVQVSIRTYAFFLFFKKYLFIYYIFIYFWLCQVSVLALRIFVAACRLLSCGMPAGSSSPTRDRTRAPCIGSTES